MDTVKQIARLNCTFHQVGCVILALCAVSIFAWGFSNRSTKATMTSKTTGTLSNVVSTKTGNQYTVNMNVTYTFKKSPKTQALTSPRNTYTDGQTVELVYDPKTGMAALAAEYVSPAKTAVWAMGIACSCLLSCLVSFMILSTDWGCAIVSVGQAVSMVDRAF
jgi:hypothetical protein